MPDAELQLRVQCLERVLARIPIVGQDYSRELQRIELKKLEMGLTPDAELQLRVQCIERVLARIPIVG